MANRIVRNTAILAKAEFDAAELAAQPLPDYA